MIWDRLRGFPANRLMGRVSSGSGAPEALTAAQGRTLLELGNAATRNVGTTAGTVCAGDDARLGVTGIGGTVGTADNRVPRSDGTAGNTLQQSTVEIDDDGQVIIRRAGDVTGLQTIRLSHDTIRAIIESLTGPLRLRASSIEFQRTSDNQVPLAYNGSDTVSLSAFLNALIVTSAWGDFRWGNDTNGCTIRYPAPHVLAPMRMNDFATGLQWQLPHQTLTIATSQNDYVQARSTYYRINATSPVTVTGIAGGLDGIAFEWVNVSANAVTLPHQSASSTAANRFLCKGSTDIVLAQDETAVFRYDGTASRYRVRKA